MLLKTLERSSTFVLLAAPPAWGKTSLILDLYVKSQKSFVFISPLKSINYEFHQRSKNLPSVYYIQSKNDLYSFIKKSNRSLMIVNVESLDINIYNYWNDLKDEKKPIFVLDEFHLFYYWGKTFRYLLWEHTMGLAVTGGSLLGLSATLSPEIIDSWRDDFSYSMDSLYFLDLGNRTFGCAPEKIDYYPPFLRKVFIKDFYFKLIDKEYYPGRFLYFCRTRNEVTAWIEHCRSRKIEAIGCVGGSVDQFQLDLKQSSSQLRCIFATYALSHGVNLPTLHGIFISFPLNNRDYWLQMAGRGGRRTGDKFKVYSLDHYSLSVKECFYSACKVLITAFVRGRLW